jgi:hypothetical protein
MRAGAGGKTVRDCVRLLARPLMARRFHDEAAGLDGLCARLLAAKAATEPPCFPISRLVRPVLLL